MKSNAIDTSVPFHMVLLDRKISKFKKWLVMNGSLIHDNTNSFEVLRFEVSGCLAIIYRKANDTLTWSANARQAWDAFCRNDPSWKARQRVKRTKSKRHTDSIKNTLVARDGQYCIYCGKYLELNNLTIEHVISLSRGGPDTIDNMVLACCKCNSTIGSANIAIKMRSVRNRFCLP